MWFEHFTSSVLNRVFPKPHVATPAGIRVGTQVDPPHSPVVFPDRHRNQHLVVVGKTGFGKTHALEFVVTQLAERGEGFAFFDFHGDASLSLIGRLLKLPRAEERLIVVDPSHPTRSPGINVLASSAAEADRFRKVSEIASILRQRWGVDSFGARTEELLRNSLFTLAGTGRTLADLPKLLTDADLRQRWTDKGEHPDIQTYWRDRYEPLSEGMKAAFREPLLNRVTAFLTEPAARHLLGQSESTVDVSRVMRHQQWLIIRLPKGRLREHAHTLGNLLFAQLQFAALAREALPVHERRTFTLVCDEVQNLAENDLGTLITEGRKFGISVITANQFWEQLPKELRGALLSAASHICFRVSSADASILAGELNLEGRSRLTVDLTNLVRGEAVGRFGSQPVVRFRVPALVTVSPLSAAVLDTLIAPITRPREEIERQLRQQPPPETAPTNPTAEGPPVKEGLHEW
jgi:Type IV secretion-system coupling protein DNA-binding domain